MQIFQLANKALVMVRQLLSLQSRALRRLAVNTLGGLAVSTAIAGPVVLGAVGVAADVAVFTMKQSKLQAAADAAAVAAARELSVVQGTGAPPPAEASMAKLSMAASEETSSPIEDIARAYVLASLGNDGENISTRVEVDNSTGSVRVIVEDRWQPFFAHLLGADITPISTDARAGLVGETKVCVIGTSPTGVGAVSLTTNASLVAGGCSVYSNSTNSAGFYLGSGSKIDADLVCSAGGIFNKGGTSSTELLTDCPPIEDPLAGRAKPSVGACDFKSTKISGGNVTLKPGVYCGGINISGKSVVTFEEGEYIIKDGLFLVRQDAEVHGSNVAFYLTGAASLIQFFDNALVDLSGAEEGDMAGLLFFEDPSSSAMLRIHNIRATRANNLTGTIYLPKSTILIDPAAAVADESAYTAIIAMRLVVENGPKLVLNTNYSATKVPVPNGIRSSADVVLTE
jgi:Flp pilus assembly protein TadG